MDRTRVVVSVTEKAGASIIRLRRPGGEEFEVVTNGNVEKVEDLEPADCPSYDVEFWWEAEGDGEPSHSEGHNQPPAILP